MSRLRIPYELRALPQWLAAQVTWDEKKGKYNKKPVDAKTGFVCDGTNPASWTTFEQAEATGLPIGFALTQGDPYCVIDLDTYDDPSLVPLHTSIVKGADTYVETSYSGKGTHIVVRANLPAGLRDDSKGLEIYPHGRFMVMTGDVVIDAPINDGQELVDYLASQIQTKRVETVNDLATEDSGLTDEQVWERASAAENGHKFQALFQGTWIDFPEYQNDHSRADLALLTFLDFYTRDVEQVIRLFKYSKLYRSEKGRRDTDGTDYIIRTLKAARARNEADAPPPVDLSAIAHRAEQVLLEAVTPPPIEPVEIPSAPIAIETPVNDSGIVPPPGLVGEIAKYIYMSAIRQVPEVALAGALTLMAGVAGRHYNISGTGLNLYIILLAATGSGKEGSATGIHSLVRAVRETVPSVDQFVGPADFASGQGLIRALADKPSMFCLLGEFGLRMQQMANPRANSSEKMLQRALLNLFSKSGWGQTESGTAYSDKDKNTALLHSPALTIFGESPPETFYEALDDTQVTSGLLPRFIFIEYKGIRPPRNRATAFCDPNPELIQRLANLVATVVQMQANGACQSIGVDENAQQLLDQFDAHADSRINGSNEVHKHLWNRAHLKALRLAGLVAVGNNVIAPIVDTETAQWAIDFVKRDLEVIEGKFRTEEIGDGEHRFEKYIRDLIVGYLSKSAEQRATYKVPASILNEQIIPYTYIRRRLRQLSAFKSDRRGASRAIQDALKDLCDADILQLIPMSQRKEKFGLTADIYVLGQSW